MIFYSSNLNTVFKSLSCCQRCLRFVAAAMAFGVISCSEIKEEDNHKEDQLAETVATFGFHVVDMAQSKFEPIDKLESLDRDSYAPISFERARIRSDMELDGWHGPTIGNYYLAIETYGAAEDATKRAAEYLDFKRFATVAGYDDPHDLGKTSVRCWAYASGNRVYLLSSHAAAQAALEARTNTVLNGVKAYEQKRGKQDALLQPATRGEANSE